MARLIDQVVGHEPQKNHWLKAFGAGQLAHAFLFVGPSGVGKKTLALAFAQKLICPQGGCGTCGSCIRVAQKASESLYLVESEERQIKIETAKEVIRFLSLRSSSPSRVVILDEADRLNTQAANALLKVIEEPPQGSFFFLTAPSEGALLATLRSRCQVMRFSPLSEEEIQTLKGLEKQDWRLAASRGSLDLLEKLSDPDLAQLREKAFINLHRLLLQGQFEDEFLDVFKKREEAGLLLQFWQQLLRDVRIYQIAQGPLVHRDFQNLIQEMAALDSHKIDRMYELTLQLERDWESNVDRQMLLMACKVEMR